MKICALTITKDENIKYIYEWVDYHYNLGVDHFFILDNNSSDSKLSINDKRITIIPFNDIQFVKPQWIQIRFAYNYAIRYIFNLDYDYMIAIDPDEYFTSKYQSIKEYVQYEMINKDINCTRIRYNTYDDNNIIYEKDVDTMFNSCTTIQKKQRCSFNIFDNLSSGFKTIVKIYPFNDYENKEEVYFIHGPNFENNIKYSDIWQDPNIAAINHYRLGCLEKYIKRKVKSQGFKIMDDNDRNIVSDYFSINAVTIEKIDAFYSICKENNVELTNDEINTLENFRNEYAND